MDEVIGIVMGGGRGQRLFPLTKERSKPAVPFAGKYRIIDIPISNCLNSHINKIFVLTQFNSASLNKHVVQTYKFDMFNGGFVDILAAEQTPRQCRLVPGHRRRGAPEHQALCSATMLEHIAILSGDQLYQMDLRQMHKFHLDCKARDNRGRDSRPGRGGSRTSES